MADSHARRRHRSHVATSGPPLLRALAARATAVERDRRRRAAARRRLDRRRRRAGCRPTSRATTSMPVCDGADAVVHLAWLIQPSRDERAHVARRTSTAARRVFEAAAARRRAARSSTRRRSAPTPPGPKDRAVDESWPTRPASRASFYARHKAAVERDPRRARGAPTPRSASCACGPGLIFQREAATEIRRLFAGPFLPARCSPPRAHARSCRAIARLRLPGRPRATTSPTPTARGARATRQRPRRLQHRRRRRSLDGDVAGRARSAPAPVDGPGARPARRRRR